jgi:hypothetical protein
MPNEWRDNTTVVIDTLAHPYFNSMDVFVKLHHRHPNFLNMKYITGNCHNNKPS